jgi:hypothetical protein
MNCEPFRQDDSRITESSMLQRAWQKNRRLVEELNKRGIALGEPAFEPNGKTPEILQIRAVVNQNERFEKLLAEKK